MNIASLSRLRRWYRLHFGWKWYRGNYPDWAAARSASAGYDAAPILEKVVAATRAVRTGRALWERDGALFYVPCYNDPLLQALNQCAKASGRLEVVDFGGSLGSTWWQHRAQLNALGLVAWRVVEQAQFVEAGREFEGEGLSFHANLAEAWTTGRPTVVLFSGVLQCIENPSEILRELVRLNPEHIVLDRTPFVLRGATRLAVQHTPPELGGGTYPCWHFEQSALLAALRENYDLVSDWAGADDVDITLSFRGLHLQRKTLNVDVKGH
jgi:putative methyltransferase (TIGR04325 family)